MRVVNAESLLNFAESRGIIDISYVQETLEMTKREECLEMHPYKIWEGKDGKWYTYLPDKEKGRLLKKKKTRDAIEDEIVLYWLNEIGNPTVYDVFKEWNDRRLELGKIANSTHWRNEKTFERHFDQMGKQHMKSVTADDIEEFLEEQIPKYNLTAKGFANLKTVTKGILKYAKKKKLINFAVQELFDDMDVSDRDFKKVVREDYEEVFNDAEMDYILQYLTDNLDIQNLGILVLFVTGMRIGELVTLKHSDIDGNTIKIRRTETVYQDENGRWVYAVKEFPKTKAGVRTVVIPKDYSWLTEILRYTNPDSDFIFVNRGRRMSTQSIRNRLYRVCEKLDIYEKSPHKIRKTYGSILLDNNVDEKLVTELMGHTNISVTEQYYHRNRRTLDEKVSRISEIPEFMTK